MAFYPSKNIHFLFSTSPGEEAKEGKRSQRKGNGNEKGRKRSQEQQQKILQEKGHVTSQMNHDSARNIARDTMPLDDFCLDRRDERSFYQRTSTICGIRKGNDARKNASIHGGVSKRYAQPTSLRLFSLVHLRFRHEEQILARAESSFLSQQRNCGTAKNCY